MLPKASKAVTVNEWATPAVVAGKPATWNVEAAAAVTPTVAVLVGPKKLLSAAVMVCVPAVFNVAVNTCVPESLGVKNQELGNPACASLLEKLMSPEYDVRLPYASIGVRVKFKAL